MELTAFWSIIASAPISTLVGTNMQFVGDRKKLFNEIQPIAEGNKVEAAKNEVVRTAYKRLNTEWSDGMKKLVSDALPLAPQVIQGLERQKLMAQKRAEMMSSKDNIISKIENEADRITRAAQEHLERHNLIEDKIREARDAYIKRRSHGENILDEKALGKEFDKFIAPGVRDSMNKDGQQRDSSSDKQASYDNSTLLQALTVAGSGVGEIIADQMDATIAKRGDRVIAWDMIQHLKDSVDSQCIRQNSRDKDCNEKFTPKNPDRIYITGMGKHANETLSLKDFIVEIFQQNERDNGRVSLGDSLVGELSPAVDIIAEHIADGTISAGALLKLVGEHKVIIHQGNSKRFATEEQVKEAISELVSQQTSKSSSFEEFVANYANPDLAVNTIKHNLETLTGLDRALFAHHMPEEVLRKVGVRKSDIETMRQQVGNYVDDVFAAEVVRLAQHHPDELKKLGMTDNTIDSLKELALNVVRGNDKAVDIALHGRDRNLANSVSTAMLNEQMTAGADGQKVWTDAVGRAENIQGQIQRLRDDATKANGSYSERVERSRRGNDKPSPTLAT